MAKALEEAQIAFEKDEVPIGALIIDKNGQILSSGHNCPLASNDPTAHAEIVALRKTGWKQKNYRLEGKIVISTLEPCLMCLGAMINARVQGLVFSVRDPKNGAIFSRIKFPEDLSWLNHRFWVVEGILADKSQALLKSFFASKRSKNGEVPKSGHNGPDSKSGRR